jgi:hypothetical protein
MKLTKTILYIENETANLELDTLEALQIIDAVSDTFSIFGKAANSILAIKEIENRIKNNKAEISNNNSKGLSIFDKYNMTILSLISNICLNIIKIENIYQEQLVHNRHILHKFCHINYIAVEKICKKILKLLHIDVRNYFENIMLKKNIIKKYTKHSLLSYLLKLI